MDDGGGRATYALGGTAEDVAFLRTPRAIRERSRLLYERAVRGDSRCFEVHLDALEPVASYVAGVASELPKSILSCTHGRMRHFDAGGTARVAALERRIEHLAADERARVKLDLVVPSVLLDAGAGDRWVYVDREGVRHARSEGLAIASYELFTSGGFASDGASLRTDAEGLARLGPEAVAHALQVSKDNPLVGARARARILERLGLAMKANPAVFGGGARPGHLYDALAARAERGRVHAADLVTLLLTSLAPIWPGEISIAGENLGDAWLHAGLGSGADAVVPFHKLTQWLAYSLVEPLAEGGVEVVGGSELTGLADYRNGGLLLDAGVLSLREGEDAAASRACRDEIVVEWRALTVALFDELAPRVASRIGRRLDDLKPGAIECMTWSAGRKIAFEKRPHGGPPLALERDGTFF